MARGALLAKCGTLGGLDDSAENVSGAAERRLLGVDAGDVEALLGVVVAVRGAKLPAAFWDDADAAPGTVGDIENLCEELLRALVAVEVDDALVGVFNFVASGLELNDGAANAVEKVERFEA